MSQKRGRRALAGAQQPINYKYSSTANSSDKSNRRQGSKLQEFSDACRGVFSCVLFSPHEQEFVADQLAKADDGDPTAQGRMLAVDMFLDGLAHGERTFCIGCLHQFHARTAKPLAFVVLLPYSNADKALVCAFCEACMREKDLPAIARQEVRSIWPDVYEMSFSGDDIRKEARTVGRTPLQGPTQRSLMRNLI
jgi:hypothetical protein